MTPTLRYFSVLLLLVFCTWANAAPKKSASRAHRPAADISANRLSQRISALETLYELQTTREQLTALQKMAVDTAQPAGDDKAVQIKQDLKHVMLDLHDALVAASNRDKIESLEEKYYGRLESEKVEFDDDVDTTEAAAEKAEEFSRSLTAGQVASLVSANQDDIQDPRDVLVQAVIEGRMKTGTDWNELRDSAADDAATLTAGIKATDTLTEKYKRWLDEAHELGDAAFKQRFSNPLQAAEKVTGQVAWPDVMRNWVQSSIADLLSNPELLDAVNERLK